MEMCIDTPMNMYTDMCINLGMDMCLNVCEYKCVYRCVYVRVFGAAGVRMEEEEVDRVVSRPLGGAMCHSRFCYPEMRGLGQCCMDHDILAESLILWPI